MFEFISTLDGVKVAKPVTVNDPDFEAVIIATVKLDRGYAAHGTGTALVSVRFVDDPVWVEFWYDLHTKLWVVYRIDSPETRYQEGSADYVVREDVIDSIKRIARAHVSDEARQAVRVDL